MKPVISFLICSSIFLLSASAQKIERFYGADRKESDPSKARYYALIEKKDSLWEQRVYFIPERKVQMVGTYLDSNCKKEQGKFYYYYPFGQLQMIGEYNDHKREGIWLSFHENGLMRDSVVYKNGKRTGLYVAWHPNGFMADSATYNDDESGVLVTWFDDGTPSSAGRYVAGRKMHGKWQFFHFNGKLSCVETYDSGKLIKREYYDETGAPVADTIIKNQQISFAGKEKSWLDFLAKNIDARIPASSGAPVGAYTVMIRFAVDINGKVTDVYPLTNFGFGMEKEAIRVVKKTSWTPAIDHGRRVKTYHTQPVTFTIQRR